MQWFTELSTAYFITENSLIKTLRSDKIYSHSRFVFNYILMDVIYLKFELIDLSVISNWQSVDFNPCIKNRTINWQESEGAYKETTEKQKRQAKRHTESLSSLKPLLLEMTKTFNIRYLSTFLNLLQLYLKARILIKICIQTWQNDIVIIFKL